MTRPIEELHPGWMDKIAKGICTQCGGEAIEFKDTLSRKEQNISGMCQKCQDKFFAREEEPTRLLTVNDYLLIDSDTLQVIAISDNKDFNDPLKEDRDTRHRHVVALVIKEDPSATKCYLPNIQCPHIPKCNPDPAA